MRKIIFLCLLLFSPILLANIEPDFGIIVAVPDEAQVILRAMHNKQLQKQGLYKYYVGNINRKRVVLLIGGAGLINTAVATTNLINYFNPEHIIFSGTAGGIKLGLNVGDVIITKKAYIFDAGDPNEIAPSWPDFPPHPIKKIKDPVIFFANKHLINHAEKVLGLNIYALTRGGQKIPAKIIIGSIASTDHFPNNNNDVMRMKELKIDAVAMEIASMMKVCWIYNKDCIGFRGISDVLDLHNSSTKYTSWNKQNEIFAADNAGKTVVKFIKGREL